MKHARDVHETLAHHDQRLVAMETRLGGVERVVLSVDAKLDRMLQDKTKEVASKPAQVLEWVRTIMSILTGAAFLVGCTVAAIVYVSSNANNGVLTLLNWRVQQVENLKGWHGGPVVVRPAK